MLHIETPTALSTRSSFASRLGRAAGLALCCTLLANPGHAGSQSNANECRISSLGLSERANITLAGVAAPNPTPDGASFEVTAASLLVEISSDLVLDVYELGLLSLGPNPVPASFSVEIQASNTVESLQTLAVTDSLASTTITDPDGQPGSGDESATPLVYSEAIASTTWTADSPAGDPIALRQATVEATVEVSLQGQPLPIPLSCDTELPALPFETVAVELRTRVPAIGRTGLALLSALLLVTRWASARG